MESQKMRLWDIYEKFLSFASANFIVRAVFPWIFVLFVDLAIYETLIHDGRSLIGLLSGMQENFQAYTALATAAVVAGLALISDSIANVLISWRRNRTWKNRTAPPPDRFPFEVEPWQSKSRVKGGVKNLVIEIERVHVATQRSANLAIGFGVSIWIMVYELARYQESLVASMSVITAMGLLVIGSVSLAEREIAILTALDRIHRSKNLLMS
jgi:hypothetical protein